MRDILIEKGAKNVVIMDLSRDDMARAVENAFRYSKMVLACATYDGGIFPFMEDFLNHLKAKNYQKRTVAFMENGSWAPAAAKLMKGMLEKRRTGGNDPFYNETGNRWRYGRTCRRIVIEKDLQ